MCPTLWVDCKEGWEQEVVSVFLSTHVCALPATRGSAYILTSVCKVVCGASVYLVMAAMQKVVLEPALAQLSVLLH